MTDTEKTLAADVLAERGVLTRRAPLRSRSTFSRRPAAVELSLTREARLEARAARALAGAMPRAATMAGAARTSSAPITKETPLRSERYRRAVASLPCAYCGIEGYSQLIDRVSAFAATELGVTFPATFQQWEDMQVDPDTGEIIGGLQCQ